MAEPTIEWESEFGEKKAMDGTQLPVAGFTNFKDGSIHIYLKNVLRSCLGDEKDAQIVSILLDHLLLHEIAHRETKLWDCSKWCSMLEQLSLEEVSQ